MTPEERPPPSRLRRAARRRLVVLAAALIALHLAWPLAGLHWMAELTVHFVPHLAVAAALLAAALMATGRPRWAGACAAVLAVDAWRLGAAVPGPGEVAGAEADTVRLLQWNVSAVNPDPERALAWILERELDLDVIALMETSPPWRPVLDALARFYPHSHVVVRSDHFGMAVFSRLPGSAPRSLTHARSGLESIVMSAYTASGTMLALWFMHPPPPVSGDLANERNAQLVSVARTARVAPMPLVVAGDLNVTPWSPWFRGMLEAGGLRDMAGGLHAPTWAPGPVPWFLGIPLDHLLATPGITLRDRALGPHLGSDHRPIVSRLAVSAPGR